MESFLERWASTGRVPMDEELRLLIESLAEGVEARPSRRWMSFHRGEETSWMSMWPERAAGLDLPRRCRRSSARGEGQGNSFATRFVRPKGIGLEKSGRRFLTSLVGAEPVKQWQSVMVEKGRGGGAGRFAQTGASAGTGADGS